MKTLSSLPKKPTLATIASLILSVRDELKHELTREIGDVQEAVEFLKDNAVMRSEFREGIRHLENKIVDHVDHFVQLHKKQEVELVALSHRMDRHEDTFHKKP